MLYRQKNYCLLKADVIIVIGFSRCDQILSRSSLREWIYGYQGEVGREGTDWEFGMDMYTLLYLKWITNKDLLYSTGNAAQYSINNLSGKRIWKRIDTCIGITESLCYTHETNTILLISYTPMSNKKLKRFFWVGLSRFGRLRKADFRWLSGVWVVSSCTWDTHFHILLLLSLVPVSASLF